MLCVARRFLAVILAGAALSTGGCNPPDEGATRVAVIGNEPRVLDPSRRDLSEADLLLTSNVAQGLVRFDARGQIVPGLAERWNVSNDGMSYIFRIAAAEWKDGSKVTAEQVARLLRQATARRSRNPLRDSLGAVAEIVAMTDRVIEIRLDAPRPNLLQLLAQPELSIVRGSGGTGPFTLEERRGSGGELQLTREIPEPDGEQVREEEVALVAASASDAIRAFQQQKIELVLGGTFVDLPLARAARLAEPELRFDPVAGLFGLEVLNAEGALGTTEVRQLLSRAIDREAFVSALSVPGLLTRATILQGGLEGIASVQPPDWTATPIAERRPALIAEAERLFGVDEKPQLSISLPDGPGADLLFRRLETDWGVLGIKLVRSKLAAGADLGLVDRVAPSTSPSWFLRRFRCQAARICVEEADELLESARDALIPAQRAALFYRASLLMDQDQLFIPIAAPVRWSLVSPNVQGFAGNRFARHTLTGLRDMLERTASE
jgi:peptide/nickel transport system substrate-binding protein